MTDRARRELEAIAAHDGPSGWPELMWWADWQIERRMEEEEQSMNEVKQPTAPEMD